MNKFTEIIEFSKQYISTEETKESKEVLAFTGALSFDMDKIRKDIEKIWNFIGQSQAFPTKTFNLGTLVYDCQYEQYNYLQSCEEIVCIDLLLGLMLASAFVIEDSKIFKQSMVMHYNAYSTLWNLDYENMSEFDYYRYGLFIYERLFDRSFHLQTGIVDRYSDKIDELTADDIKNLLRYWFKKDVSEDEFPGVYEDFEFAVNCYLDYTLATILSMSREDKAFNSHRLVEHILATDVPFVDAIYYMGMQLSVGNRKAPFDLVKNIFLVKLKKNYEQEFPENKLTMK